MAKNPAPESETVLDDSSLSALAEAVKPQPLAADRKTAIRERLFDRIQPSAPQNTRTLRAQEMQWLKVLPKVEMKILNQDQQNKYQTALWRLQPGAVVPSHPHDIEEECWVIEGEIKIGDHLVRQGDMHIALAGSHHAAMTTDVGALLLVRGQIGELANMAYA